MLEQRAADAPQQSQRLMAREPLFCMDTAVRLLYYAGLAYEHDEVSLQCRNSTLRPTAATAP